MVIEGIQKNVKNIFYTERDSYPLEGEIKKVGNRL
jgi:hypothetical protein